MSLAARPNDPQLRLQWEAVYKGEVRVQQELLRFVTKAVPDAVMPLPKFSP